MARTAGIAVLGILTIGVAACSHGSAHAGSTSGTRTASSTATSAPTAVPLPSQVGKATQIGDVWQATVNGATTSAGTASTKLAKAGDVFVVIDISLKNISSQPQQVSSLLEFRLSDTHGTLYTETVTNSFGAPPGGTIASQGATRGVLVFEVPAAQRQFTLSFEPQLSTPIKATWAITIA
jgi:hypothetical protein